MPNYGQQDTLWQAAHMLVNFSVTFIINRVVKNPYMDEIFHFGQGVLFYHRIYDQYDPAITTPPGLYFFSSFLLHLFQREPTLLTLRSITSTPLLFFLPDLFCSILRQLTDSTSQRSQSHNPPPPTSTTIFTAKHLRNSLEGKIITFFPLIVFFGGLYYTDLVGMGGVLLVYHLSMKEGDGWAGIIGLLTLTVRQTNVIWIAWILGTSILRMIEIPSHPSSAISDEEDRGLMGKGEEEGSMISQGREKIVGVDIRERRKNLTEESAIVKVGERASAVKLEQKEIFEGGGLVRLRDLSTFHQSLTYLLAIPQKLVRNPWDAIRIAKWYIPTFVAFGIFLWVNGGIVLGHQEHHTAGLHFPQVMYFLSFSTIMGWPVLLDGGVKRAVKGVWKFGMGGWRQMLLSAIVLVMMNIAVAKFTIVHPFLLADNRHYFFYVWRKVYQRHWSVRYALTPGYLVCGWAWVWKLGQHHSLYWIISFFGATALVLVPAPLVEPRYFLIPYILMRLHSLPAQITTSADIDLARRKLTDAGLPSDKILKGWNPPAQEISSEQKEVLKSLEGQIKPRLRWLYVEMAWYAVINVVTIGLFVGYTFKWEGWEDPMRFMW